ncbi:MAG: penicillin acylase family protein [Pseudomonadota bacterium]|nr:penicillin acylase family protein [Pseudomonadota bacterium]
MTQLTKKLKWLALFLFALGGLSLLGISSCSLLTPLPEPQSLQQRLEGFSQIPTPQLEQPVEVLWNDYGVPFIIANTDQDAAFMLGMVQAHLRLNLMEVGKRIAYGRLSEMAGPVANEVDLALRTLDFTQAIPESLALMAEQQPSTLSWLNAFADGVNHYKANMPERTHTMKVLGMENEPWTAADTLALTHLGGTDVNWLGLANLLPAVGTDGWPQTLQRIQQTQQQTKASFTENAAANVSDPSAKTQIHDQQQKAHSAEKLAILETALLMFARSGSNSFAISADKSASGAPLIASDPHLGFSIPNIWLIAGLKSPSFHYVGMMPSGVPVIAFGRNQYLAWGGTNMRQEASDFVQLSEQELPKITYEQHDIQTRFWLDSNETSRAHPVYGPIVSDLELFDFPEEQTIALRWVGHQPSDEMTAMLNMAQAQNWQALVNAAKPFSLPGQNFVFATKSGDIGQFLATHIPTRHEAFPEQLFVTPKQSDAYFSQMQDATTLPYSLNPASGRIASSNNKPYTDDLGPRISWLFPADDRIERIYQLLDEKPLHSVEDMQLYQRDAYAPRHHALAQFLSSSAASLEGLSEQTQAIIQRFAQWDGQFSHGSEAAVWYNSYFVALEQTAYDPQAAITESAALEGWLEWAKSSGYAPEQLIQDISALSSQAQAKLLNQTSELAQTQINELMQDKDPSKPLRWGDVHQMQVQHVLGNLPLLGSRYQFQRFGVDGHNQTVMKTSAGVIAEPHTVRYGSQSRHVSDLGDINANHFVLYGGQDGQLLSENALDQVPMWQEGRYIQVPLELDQIRAAFTRKTLFSPR